MTETELQKLRELVAKAKPTVDFEPPGQPFHAFDKDICWPDGDILGELQDNESVGYYVANYIGLLAAAPTAIPALLAYIDSLQAGNRKEVVNRMITLFENDTNYLVRLRSLGVEVERIKQQYNSMIQLLRDSRSAANGYDQLLEQSRQWGERRDAILKELEHAAE